jgi:hypothetical protein
VAERIAHHEAGEYQAQNLNGISDKANKSNQASAILST